MPIADERYFWYSQGCELARLRTEGEKRRHSNRLGTPDGLGLLRKVFLKRENLLAGV